MPLTPAARLPLCPALAARAALAVVLAAAAGPACALFKVVGPDGSVTYTDRPPAAAGSRVTPLASGAAGRAADAASAAPGPAGAFAGLPFELRQIATRFPVTLYTTADCAPCDSGRRWLRERGVPFLERRIESEEDIAALEKLVGARMVPSLTVGAQGLRGIETGQWSAYLDAAGYPREGRLPPTWRPPEPETLVPRRAVDAAPSIPAPAATTPPTRPAPGTAPTPEPGGFRF